MWITVAAIALVVAGGCNGGSQSTATAAQQPEGSVSRSASGLTVAVSTDQRSVAPAGRLRIQVTVTNRSSAPIDLKFTSGCQTDYELLDADGKLIGSSMQMCTQSLTDRTLAAGASFTDTHVWIRGMAGMPQPTAGSSMRVRGVLLANGGEIRSEETATVALP